MNVTSYRRSLWLLAMIATGCLGGLAGCQPFDHYDTTLEGPAPAALEPPRELAKTTMPVYRIEAPDVLFLDVPKLVPLPPYRLESFDLVYVAVLGALPDQPINGQFLVDDEGRINLGPGYGMVRVAGMTVDEAARAVDAHLRQFLRLPEVMFQLARPSSIPQVSGQYLVAADGTINLRQYGAVPVAGKTMDEARTILEQHLGRFFDSPKVALDVVAYNSKVYYIITAGAGLGDNVVRVPVTGNETVLDAVAQVRGLSQVSSKKIWIARPAPHGFHCEQVLPVDWDAVAQGGSTATNYQLLPGDRLYIASDQAVAANNWLNKVFQPIERIMGVSSLTASTVRNMKFIGSQQGGNNF